MQKTAQKQDLAARVFSVEISLDLQSVCGCWGEDFLAFKRVRTSRIDRIRDRGDVKFFDRELTASIMDRFARS